jgi:hypothetical protein
MPPRSGPGAGAAKGTVVAKGKSSTSNVIYHFLVTIERIGLHNTMQVVKNA